MSLAPSPLTSPVGPLASRLPGPVDADHDAGTPTLRWETGTAHATAPWWETDAVVGRSHRRALAPPDLLEVAEGLARAAHRWPGLDDPVERCWRTIALTRRFEAWLVAWPAGGAVELHDHGRSGGAVVVVSGDLVELSVSRAGRGIAAATTPVPAGGHVLFGRGHVHDLVNEGPGPALSVHVYTPELRSMTYFDLRRTDRLVPVRTEQYRHGLLVG